MQIRVDAFVRRVLSALVVTQMACTGPATPAPPTPDLQASLTRRHYDQVCRIATEKPPVATSSELLDVGEVRDELSEIGSRPLPADRQTEALRWGTVDFIARYGRDGRPTVTGVWETTVDSATGSEVERVLRSRVRRLPGLLIPVGSRIVVELSPAPVVSVGSPVTCLPHMKHEPGERPIGLPDGVATVRERAGYRPRGGAIESDDRATLRIWLDPDGRVVRVEPVAGSERAVARAREVLWRIAFDPALENGEGVATELLQTFRFQG